MDLLVIACQFRLRILTNKIGFDSLLGVSETNGSNSTFRCCNQHVSKWALDDGVPNPHTPSSLAVSCRCHTKLDGCALIHTATGLITSIVDCSCHRLSLMQSRLELLQAARLDILTWGDAFDPLERTLEMIRTHMKLLA